MRLVPRDHEIFALLATSAEQAEAAAGLLAELLGAAPGEDQREVARRLGAVEHRGDAATHALVRQVTTSFVTPFDREDVLALGAAVEACTDAVEDAGAAIVVSGVGELPPRASDVVALVQRQAEVVVTAVARLHAVRDLADHWVEVNRLQNEAQHLGRALLEQLFATERDAVQLLRVKHVLDALQVCARAFEHVAHVVEAIAVKES